VRALPLIAVLLLALDAGAANIYRCTTAKGVAYQEQPCEAEAREASVGVGEFPPANTAERNRLLEREAALDARMIKRAELDTAERIAKEARWAREAELEAERQRAKAAESQYYYLVVPAYGRPVRSHPAYRPGTSAVRY
jgi:pyocin large subunit-like protein